VELAGVASEAGSRRREVRRLRRTAESRDAGEAAAYAAPVRTLFTYGPGIPRYLGMWLLLAPPLVVGLLAFGVRRSAVAVVVLSTLFTIRRNPPQWLEPWMQWTAMVAALAATTGWLAARVRSHRSHDDNERGPAGARPRRVNARAVLALVAVALALRVPLAWLDPGIAHTATATELAARQLLDGHNPYLLPNPHSDAGTYQYPIGTALVHAPLVAAVPETVLGEEHLGVRATIWLTEAAAVVALAWLGARFGHPRGGLAAAFAYAVHPTLVRESGMTVANDLILAVLVVAAAAAFTTRLRRPLLGGLLVGLAISVKPPALVVLPVVLVAWGLRPTALAAAVPAALQLPFLLLPSPGLHGVRAIAEPATRAEPMDLLVQSVWWPLYGVLGNGAGLQRALAYAGLAASLAAAAWAGRQLRARHPDAGRLPLAPAAAALGLPLLVSFALAAVQRTNYQDWHLAALLLCAGLTVPRVAPGPLIERRLTALTTVS
jgi:hypothetical protein